MDLVISILTKAGIIFLIVMFFNLMIFVHELGHFWAARWRGLYIDRFQIWFGKPIWKKTVNGVQWGLGWIPAGGFVSLPQMVPMEAIEGEVTLPADLKPVSPVDKIIVAAAGPLASLALAVFFAVIVWGVGKPNYEIPGTTIGYVEPSFPAAEAGLLPGDRILSVDGHEVDHWAGDMVGVMERIMLGEDDRIQFLIQRPGVEEPMMITTGYKIPEKKWWERAALRQVGLAQAMPAIVGEVMEGSPAQKAGLREGDVVEALEGQKVWSPAQVTAAAREGKPMELTVKRRNGETAMLAIVPELPENWKGLEEGKPIMGFSWSMEKAMSKTIEHPGPVEQVVQSLGLMKDTIMKVAAPKSSVKMEHMSGPVGIGTHFYRLFIDPNGLMLVLWFAVVLNVNLAVLNILPFPVLDGGHVVMNTLELIFKRPFSGRFLEVLQMAFAFAIMGFFIFVTSKDVGDFFGPSSDSKLPSPPVFKQG